MVAACATISVLSLALPATLAFDPWAWLVWGREIGHLELDTTGGPSWKPLPVLVTTVLGAAGDLAPTLWLVVARTAGLLAVVVTYRLAARFAGPAAGVVAAGLLLLTPDGGPRFLRLVIEGHSAPVTATLCLWAVDRHLEGRHAQALLLATAFSLERPEAWPFLVAYAVWLWRREPARRPLVAGALAVVPVLWFGADWWGSGDVWHGAAAAQVESSGLADRLSLVWDRTARMVVTPAWPAAAAALVTAWRRRERTLLVLGAGAAAWLLLVGTMSVTLGYAALSRFLLPAAAIVCVLAGVGVVRLVSTVPRGAARLACRGRDRGGEPALRGHPGVVVRHRGRRRGVPSRARAPSSTSSSSGPAGPTRCWRAAGWWCGSRTCPASPWPGSSTCRSTASSAASATGRRWCSCGRDGPRTHGWRPGRPTRSPSSGGRPVGRLRHRMQPFFWILGKAMHL